MKITTQKEHYLSEFKTFIKFSNEEFGNLSEIGLDNLQDFYLLGNYRGAEEAVIKNINKTNSDKYIEKYGEDNFYINLVVALKLFYNDIPLNLRVKS